MKKQLAMVLVYILVVTWVMSFADTVYAADNIRIFVDGDEIVSDLPPQIIKGRTLLPAKVIFEIFGFSMEWDEENRIINLNQKGYINPYQAIKIVEEITGYQYADAYDESTGRYQTKPELEYIFNIHCWVIPVINPNTVRHDGDLYVDSATGIIYNMVGERPWN